MEEIQNEMRQNQGKKNALANMRAIERQSKMPQNLESTELEPTMKGGGSAGLARVVGAGRRRGGAKKREVSPESVSSMSSGEGGARHMGRMMYAHLVKLHGKGYADKFYGSAAPRNLPPMGLEVEHARMQPALMGLPGSGLGGQDVPPNGIAPMAYGSVPQAPASFKRNSVTLGSQGLLPSAQVGSGKRKAKAPSVHTTLNDVEGGIASKNARGVYKGVEPVVSGGARAIRGKAISRIMKEKKLSLAEASKYLKAHPEEMK